MRKQQNIKIFLTLILSTAYIFSFSHFGALAYNNFFQKTDAFASGTTIGYLDVSGKTAIEMEQLLGDRVKQWKQNTKITFSYKENKTEVETSLFAFYNEETIGALKSAQKNLAVVDIDKELLEESIYSTSISLSSVDINKEKLSADLLIGATMLDPAEFTFNLENYIPEDAKNSGILTKAAINTEGSLNEIQKLVPKLKTVEIAPKSQFSLLRTVGEKDSQKHNSAALSIIGTALYNAILPTNFPIIERHISNELPSFAKLGYEAKVNEEKQMDLVFSNLNDTPYTLQLSLKGNKLEVIVKGQPFLNKYSIVKRDEKRFAPKTVMQYNARLETGQTQVIEPGKAGLLVKIVREIYDESGEFLKSEMISEDFYPPVHKVVVHSLLVPIAETETTDPETGEELESGTPQSPDDSATKDNPGSEAGTTDEEKDEKVTDEPEKPGPSNNDKQATGTPIEKGIEK